MQEPMGGNLLGGQRLERAAAERYRPTTPWAATERALRSAAARVAGHAEWRTAACVLPRPDQGGPGDEEDDGELEALGLDGTRAGPRELRVLIHHQRLVDALQADFLDPEKGPYVFFHEAELPYPAQLDGAEPLFGPTGLDSEMWRKARAIAGELPMVLVALSSDGTVIQRSHAGTRSGVEPGFHPVYAAVLNGHPRKWCAAGCERVGGLPFAAQSGRSRRSISHQRQSEC